MRKLKTKMISPTFLIFLYIFLVDYSFGQIQGKNVDSFVISFQKEAKPKTEKMVHRVFEIQRFKTKSISSHFIFSGLSYFPDSNNQHLIENYFLITTKKNIIKFSSSQNRKLYKTTLGKLIRI